MDEESVETSYDLFVRHTRTSACADGTALFMILSSRVFLDCMNIVPRRTSSGGGLRKEGRRCEPQKRLQRSLFVEKGMMALGVGALTRSTAHMPIDLSESRSYWGGSLRLSRPPPICHLSPFPLILSYSGERSFSALESERGKRGEKTSTKQTAKKKERDPRDCKFVARTRIKNVK